MRKVYEVVGYDLNDRIQDIIDKKFDTFEEAEKYAKELNEEQEGEYGEYNPDTLEYSVREKYVKDSEPEANPYAKEIDNLLKDEEEAIDGYEKAIAKVEDNHLKEQLEEILYEERKHKAFLIGVKENPMLNYSDVVPAEEPAPEEQISYNPEWME